MSKSIENISPDDVLSSIKEKNLDALKGLVEAGWKLNTRIDAKHGTALHSAVAVGDHDTVDWLLQNGAKPDKCYEKHGIPPALHYACFQGLSDIVRSLVLFKADVKQVFQGITPMTQAAAGKHFGIVKYLHSHDPSTLHQLDGFTVPSGLSVFDHAVQAGDSEMMEWVKEQAVDLTHPLPVHVAVKHNKKEALDKIIEWGGNLDKGIITAVAMSRINNQLKIFERLKEYGADFNFNDGQPLRTALRLDPNGLAVKQLIRFGADLNFNNGALLKSLVDEGNLKGLEKALEHGGDATLLRGYGNEFGDDEKLNELGLLLDKHSGSSANVSLH
jgi:ankyrin repeat protein